MNRMLVAIFSWLRKSGILVAGVALTAVGVAVGAEGPPTANGPTAPPAAESSEKREVSRYIDPDAAPLPEGAIARIGSNRLRHAGEVTGLKHSPDGKWLASISADSADATARLWDAATGKQQLLVKINVGGRARPSPQPQCHALGFSNDGKQFFVIDLTSFRAFDIDAGKELIAYAFPRVKAKKAPGVKMPLPSDVIGTGISPYGKTCVLIRRLSLQPFEICDVATGNVLRTAERSDLNYSNGVTIQFSPDSLHIVVCQALGQADKFRLTVIEVATGKTISRIEGSDSLSQSSLRFVPGTDKLVGLGAGTASGNGPVNVFDWKSGKSLGSIEVDNTTYVIEVSPDGKTLIAGNGQRLFSQIIEIETGKEIARIPSTPSLHALAFSPGGKLLAGARVFSGAITVWDMKTHDYHAAAAEPVSFYGVRFGPDSNTLSIPERGYPLIDWRTGKVLERLLQSDDRFPRAPLSLNRQWFAKTEFKDNSITIVDAKTGKELRNFKGHTKLVERLSFSRDESRLASGSYDKTIRVWSLKTGNEIAQFTAPELTGQQDIAVSDDGRIMAVGTRVIRVIGAQNGRGSVILIWDVDAKKQLARFEDETNFFSGVALSPDGKWLAAGGGENRKQPSDETAVHIWETGTGRIIHALPGHNCKNDRPGAWCAFSPDSRWLATGDASGKLRVWEVLSGQEVRSFTGHHSKVIMAQFSPDGKLLVAASADAPCFIWDVFGASTPAKLPSAAEPQAAWKELGEADAKKAFTAIRRLAASPGPSVELMRKNLKPAVGIDAKNLQDLLRDLTSDRFAARQAATAELSRIADEIEPTLRQRLIATDSADERTRLEQILKTVQTLSLKRIQEVRALIALELIATPEAIRLIDDLAAGAKDDFLTRAAADAGNGLRKRAAK